MNTAVNPFNAYYNNLWNGKPPCTRDCPYRTIGCHSNCGEYLKWKAVVEEKKKEAKIYRDANRMADEITDKRVSKIIQRRKR